MESTTINGHSRDGKQWQNSCRELAQWTWERLAIKRDRHGEYSPAGGAEWTFSPVTKEKLAAHFAGESTLGLGSTSTDDECLWVAWDLDNHGSDTATNQNLEYAIVLMNRLVELGFSPVVEDSDGKGGIHVWVMFSRPIPAATAYQFSVWVARDYAEHLDAIECFPKNSSVKHTDAKCGHYLRTPGKHHKRDHWSRFWGDGEWLSPEESVRLLLSQTGDDPELIPEIPETEPERKTEPDRPVYVPSGDERDIVVSALHAIPNNDMEYDDWLTIGMALHACDATLLDEFQRWSACSQKHDASTTATKWKSFNGNGKVQAGTIIHLAKECGWIHPSRREPVVDLSNLLGKGTGGKGSSDEESGDKKGLKTRSAWDAVENPKQMKPVVIGGLMRRGESASIIASTKVGKSWLALGLAYSVATGQPWFGRAVSKGNVLLIDNELHDETIQNRLTSVAYKLNIKPNQNHARFDYSILRGDLLGIVDLAQRLVETYQPGELTMIVLDAKYRFFTGMEENSNDDQTKFHNLIDKLALHLDCVIVMVHHATKGSQDSKSVTDVGSGGGAQSRAVDCHLVLRPHENDDHAVLDAAVRTFAPVESQTLRWEFPLWYLADDVEPILKADKTRSDNRKEVEDKKTLGQITELIKERNGEPLAVYDLRKATGIGQFRLVRLVKRGLDEGLFVQTGTKIGRSKEEAILITLPIFADDYFTTKTNV